MGVFCMNYYSDNKWTNKTKQKFIGTQTTEWSLPEGKGVGEGELDKGNLIYGNGRKLDFWWWALNSVYRYQNIMYTWNLYNVIN